MNELQIFKNEKFGTLGIWVENGKEYFPATEVAVILGYKDPHKAISTHCREDGWVIRPVIDRLGRTQQKKFIDEGNLYRLIVRSDLPEVEPFEHWVFDEVIPSIRKTGSYSIQNPVEALLENPVKLGEMLIEYGKAKEQLKIQAPKVQTYEMLYESNAVVDIGEVSKTLNFKGVGRNNLFAILRQQGILNSNNEPYQEYVNRGYFKLIPTNYVDNFGNRKMKVVAYMKGIEAISKLLLKLGYVKINPNYSMAIN
ncbi:MAG: phage antirepressor KilAC domain-containing protein [Pseudoleptotrichia goodfellowii]|nr:phage antirepressor KilAC domain-containing protein [Pseudoleptotrichia goodfellowii]